MNQNEKNYIETFCHWLNLNGVHFEPEFHTGFAVINFEKNSCVLDFLHEPYKKPEVKGLHFGIDIFLFRPTALESKIISMLKKNLTIFARNTTVVRISSPEARPFFDTYHLGGYAQAKYKYALFCKDEMVAVATFAQGRNLNLEGEIVRSYELIGFCQKKGITVTGGLSKLVKHFAALHGAQHISTTVDLDWGTGEAYIKAGFKSTDLTPPMNFRVDENLRRRIYPSRFERATERVSHIKFPFQNSGYQKFEQFIRPLKK